MKKIVALVMVAVMALSLVACSAPAPAAAETEAATEAATEAKAEGETAQVTKLDDNVEIADTGKTLTKNADGVYENLKIGLSFYNLSNPIWAEVVQRAVEYGEERGWDVSFVDCMEDGQKQISQVENFITAGCDVIIIHAIDPAAIVSVVDEAHAAGIHVISYSNPFTNAETVVTLDAVASGEALVEMAKPYIDEKYPDGKFDWVFENIPSVELGVVEGDAVEAKMKEYWPESNLLGSAEVLATEEGVNVTENFLQAYPDCRVYLGISAGVGVGANEAMKTAMTKEEWSDYLLFSVDATEQECTNILSDDDPLIGSIGLGGGIDHCRLLMEAMIKILDGEDVPKTYPLIPEIVTKENVLEYAAKTYGWEN